MVLPALWEVVRTVELDPISFGSGDSLLFRIEIQRKASAPHSYRAKVFRIETFQMRPLWPDGSRESSEAVLLSDDSYTGDVSGSDADQVLTQVLVEIDRQFGQSADRS